MAEIYRAFSEPGEPVAIKMILPEYASQPKFVQMFLDEARIVVTLRHPNIVQLLDFGKIEDTYFFSMEWVDGKPLSTIIKRQIELGVPFPIEDALLIGVDVCEGLAYAHAKTDRFDRPLGIVHRDISPPNVLVTRDCVAKIADFGIADAQNKGIQTQPGIIRGKFSYMSPEQASGVPTDKRSDVFSLGVVLWEILTSRRLFLREKEVDTLMAVRKCDIPPIRPLNSLVSPALESVLSKALAKEPHRRYASAEKLGHGLQNVLSDEYPDASGKHIAQFLKVLFPAERFFGLDEPTNIVVLKWKEEQERKIHDARHPAVHPWVKKLTEHRAPISVLLALATLAAAEWLAR